MNSEERAAEAVRVFLTKTRNGVDMEQAMQAALEAAGLNELVEALETVAKQDAMELALDPQWAQRMAQAALTAGDKSNG